MPNQARVLLGCWSDCRAGSAPRTAIGHGLLCCCQPHIRVAEVLALAATGPGDCPGQVPMSCSTHILHFGGIPPKSQMLIAVLYR
jgi:hypothetical protein